MDKQEAVKEFEYNVKLYSLRIKYAKNIFETIGLAMGVIIEANKLRTILAQPTPKFESGGVVVGDNSKEEIVCDFTFNRKSSAKVFDVENKKWKEI